MTTMTTVGYGDVTGSTKAEMIFSIMLEYAGMCSFAILTASIVQLISREYSFTAQFYQKLELLDVWVKRVERSNHGRIPANLYSQITTNVENAFRHDFNLLIEDGFMLYQKLTPRMQGELITYLFSDFIEKFDYFFAQVC
jgi:hypothetical protein